MIVKTFDRIVSSGGFPVYRIGEDPQAYAATVDAYAESLKRQGITHVKINEAVCSIPWVMDPQNSYLRFTEYGYPLNQYVSSSWDRGIYYDKLMQANRDILLAQAAFARKYGFRCYLQCVEPTFMQESFFQRHPALRGPRVDNPICSRTPLYALCAMLPEVQDHYRQLVQGMLQLVPEIDEIHIFTNDTGAGFCYSSHLYAGSNGPVHCRQTPAGKQAQQFAHTLLDAGRELNPHFRLIMTSGLGPREKTDFLDGCHEGVTASIYGAFAWGGGLEDYWGSMAVGPAVFNNPEERAKIRTWQYADMQARIAPLVQNGCPVYASYSPLYYRADDPRPYETYGIMCQLLEWGVSNIIGGAPEGQYSINGAVMRHAMDHGRQPVDEVVRNIAVDWVGEQLADKLCAVWRLTDHASCEQPMLASSGHCILLQPLIVQMPLVPDEGELDERDLDYFMTPVLRDQQTMKGHQGGVWRVLHFETETLLAYIRQYEHVVFPDYKQALTLLEECLAEAPLSGAARDCLCAQQAIIDSQLKGHRYIYTWLLAALLKNGQCTPPAGIPSLREIIDMQLALADAGGPGGAPMRVALMQRHRDDALAKVDLSEFPPQRHLGTTGWEGAHESKA